MKSEKKAMWQLFLIFFLFYVLLTRVSVSPLMYPDEAGYIGWARRILYGNGNGWRYLPGYSLFLLPSFLLGQNQIETVFPWITLTNCLFATLLPIFSYRFTREVMSEQKERFWIAIAVGFYPSIGLYANFAMPEVLLSVLFLVAVFLVGKLETNLENRKAVVMLVAVLLLMLSVHIRTWVLVAVLWLVLWLLVREKGTPGQARRLWIAGVGLLAASVLFAVVAYRMAGPNAFHIGKQIVGLFRPQNWVALLQTICSQGAYVFLSTFGLAWVGIWQGVLYIRKPQPYRYTVLFIIVSACAMMLLSATFLYHHEKADHVLYGRYNEMILPALLWMGLVGVQHSRISHRIWWPVFSCLILTGIWFSDELKGLGSNLAHTWGIYGYRLVWEEFSYWLVLPLFVAGAVGLFFLGRKHPRKIPVGLSALFLCTLLFAEYDYFYKGAAPRQEEPQLARLVKETEVVMAPDTGNSMGFSWGAYQLGVYVPSMESVDDGRYVLTNRLDEKKRLLGAEKSDVLYLYDTQGHPTEYRAELTCQVEEQCLVVEAKNTGENWLCREAVRDVRQSVAFGIQIYQEGCILEQQRIALDHNVYSGESIPFGLPFSEEGTYQVYCGMVREFEDWVPGGVRFTMTAQNGVLTISDLQEEAEPFSRRFNVFRPSWLYPGDVTGLFRDCVTEEGLTLKNLSIPLLPSDRYLVLHTAEDSLDGKVQMWANQQELSFAFLREGSYYFHLGEIEKIEEITLVSDLVCPAEQAGLPQWTSFLKADSPCKPISYLVRGMRKLFGIDWDWHRYGIKPDYLEVVQQ